MSIPFNKPYASGSETDYIAQAISNGHLSRRFVHEEMPAMVGGNYRMP